MATTVFWKRYPDDAPSSRHFDNDYEAHKFAASKQYTYSYTVGVVWCKKHVNFSLDEMVALINEGKVPEGREADFEVLVNLIKKRFLHQYTAESLVQRAVKSLTTKHGRARKSYLWHVVSQRFALGSTFSKELCAKVGLDPDKDAYL